MASTRSQASRRRRLHALKASLRELRETPPRLLVDGAPVRGLRSDTRGLHHRYAVRGLESARSYTLALRDAAGEPLCDPWPLRTLPAPHVRPERFRLLVYTCAGGPEIFTGLAFLDLEVRRRLLARGLATRPDAVLANGDPVCWDLRSGTRFGMGLSPQALRRERGRAPGRLRPADRRHARGRGMDRAPGGERLHGGGLHPRRRASGVLPGRRGQMA